MSERAGRAEAGWRRGKGLVGRVWAGWETRDPDAAARLFAPDATYHETPFGPPLRGREAIREYWTEATGRQSGVSFRHEIIATTETGAVTRWWATFRRVESGEPRVRLEGVILVELSETRSCAERFASGGIAIPSALVTRRPQRPTPNRSASPGRREVRMRDMLLILHFIGLSMGLGTGFAMMALGLTTRDLTADGRNAVHDTGIGCRRRRIGRALAPRSQR